MLPLPLPVEPLMLHSAPSPPSPRLLELSAGLCFMSSIGLQSCPLIWLAGIIRSSNAVRAPFIPKHAGVWRLADDLLLFYCPSGAGRAVSREGACLCQPLSAAETPTESKQRLGALLTPKPDLLWGAARSLGQEVNPGHVWDGQMDLLVMLGCDPELTP